MGRGDASSSYVVSYVVYLLLPKYCSVLIANLNFEFAVHYVPIQAIIALLAFQVRGIVVSQAPI